MMFNIRHVRQLLSVQSMLHMTHLGVRGWLNLTK